MEQTHSKKLQLGRHVADALGEVERLGYSRSSRDRYRTTWEQLIEFSQRKDLGDEFSEDLVARFLEECRVRDQQTNAPSDGWRRHIAFEVRMLADFAKNGRFERAHTRAQVIHRPPAMQKTLRDYLTYAHNSRLGADSLTAVLLKIHPHGSLRNLHARQNCGQQPSLKRYSEPQ